MKVIIFYIITGLISALGTQAQAQSESEMDRAFEQWKNGNSAEAANLFEAIAEAEKQNWLPYYYASQVKILQSFPMTQATQKEELLDEAQRLLEESKKMGGDEVELMILQAMLHTARLTIDPPVYAMKLSPVIFGIYAEASRLAPDNPRVALSKAEWNMGHSRYFGEDPAKFCPDLKAGLTLFSKEDHSPTVAPAWGEDRLQMLLAQNCGSEN